MFSTILKFSVPVHCEVLPSLGGDDELVPSRDFACDVSNCF